jgi:hypothetical protein
VVSAVPLVNERVGLLAKVNSSGCRVAGPQSGISVQTGVASAEVLVSHLAPLVREWLGGHPVNYSYLSATSGSNRMARLAGI